VTLADLTAASFTDRLHETFAVALPTGTLDLTLAEVEHLGSSSPERQAFSLRFRGPHRPILPQAIYRLENAAMGALDIFIVPLGPRDGGICYEAVFT
jgi:hypothetical protein